MLIFTLELSDNRNQTSIIAYFVCRYTQLDQQWNKFITHFPFRFPIGAIVASSQALVGFVSSFASPMITVILAVLASTSTRATDRPDAIAALIARVTSCWRKLLGRRAT
jgi:hypothetical protein